MRSKKRMMVANLVIVHGLGLQATKHDVVDLARSDEEVARPGCVKERD
jgi:hypothetical protein